VRTETQVSKPVVLIAEELSPATVDALGRVEPDALSDEALDELVGLYRRWSAGSL